MAINQLGPRLIAIRPARGRQRLVAQTSAMAWRLLLPRSTAPGLGASMTRSIQVAITIRAHFERLAEVSLVDAYDEIGVYVLWSGKAAVRPSYIGEGNVLKRFVDHLGKPWAARPLAGMMALIEEGTDREAKWRATAIERVLLHIAGQVDRFPANNNNVGVMSGITKLVQRADHSVKTVRFVFTGQDPLLAPERPAMSGSKQAVLRAKRDVWHVEHEWRTRPVT
ncbi:MAG: hypothetical protein U0263_31190 [Polyangiaceae bacterium]